MMGAKKGLSDSIWASRGKASNVYSPPRLTSTTVAPAASQPLPPITNGSRHYPANPNPNTRRPESQAPANDSKPTPSSQHEFKRYIQIVRRLKWKLPYLSHAYHLAIAKPGDALFEGDINAQEAELMFKLDFYEYYMLLERALVHLLGVFGITIPRDAVSTRCASAARGGGSYSTHSFHQNVISTLERTDNPLHDALGTGEVLFCLSRAKELRNRWKYAEDVSTGRRVEQPGRDRAGTAPLDSYDLDRIFTYVFAGFDAGYLVAEQRVAQDTGVQVGAGLTQAGESMDIEEDEFDFMVEAMDWEAV